MTAVRLSVIETDEPSKIPVMTVRGRMCFCCSRITAASAKTGVFAKPTLDCGAQAI